MQFRYKSCASNLRRDLDDKACLSSLLIAEDHPVLLARQMLLMASSLRYLSPKTSITGLTKHHHIIMEEIAESAVKHVIKNDALLVSLDNLENIILEGYFHVDSGNMRRAWLTWRRAIAAARILGLHRPGHYRFEMIDARFEFDPIAMWNGLVTAERGLSLMLGLPTSTNNAV
jgi:hypothetical protein